VAEPIGEAIAWLKAQGVTADGTRDLLGLRRHISNPLRGAGVRDQNSLGRSSATGPCGLKRCSRTIVHQMPRLNLPLNEEAMEDRHVTRKDLLRE
jgi:hypothetical protein